VIIGDDEIAAGRANVKAMRGEAGEQQQASVPFEEVVDYVVDQIVGGGGHDCDDENCNEHGHHHRP